MEITQYHFGKRDIKEEKYVMSKITGDVVVM